MWSPEDVIHTYTRAEAIEDGLLVDVTSVAADVGITIPTAISKRVWDEVITPGGAALAMGQSETGRLWDVLWIFAIGAKQVRAAELVYTVLVDDGQGPRKVALKAVCGGGDDGKPVLTILFPEED